MATTSSAASRCRICGAAGLALRLDFGRQPICNRFPAGANETEALFPLALGQCTACGLWQLPAVAPAAELRPRVDWITYREAEGHLDAVVTDVVSRLALPSSARLLGISYKDDSTLARLRAHGFAEVARLDPAGDLGIAGPEAGVETLQERLDPARAAQIARRRGRADLLIARHILEHAHDPRAFAEALRGLLQPNGWLLCEVPDFSTALDHFDYSTLWEEHAVYFTPPTFRRAFGELGFRLEHDRIFPYPLENSLVGLARPGAPAPARAADDVAAELARGERYAGAFPERCRAVAAALDRRRAAEGRPALFGAGHLAAKFVNLMGLRDRIAMVVDDHPRKRGLYMPGSRLPILGSAALLEQRVRLCLSSLNPESEAKVIRQQEEFLRRGGVFASIFPASPRALPC